MIRGHRIEGPSRRRQTPEAAARWLGALDRRHASRRRLSKADGDRAPVEAESVSQCSFESDEVHMDGQAYTRIASIHSRRLLINQSRVAPLTSSRVSTRS